MCPFHAAIHGNAGIPVRHLVADGNATGRSQVAAKRPRTLFVLQQVRAIYFGVASLASVLEQRGYSVDLLPQAYWPTRRYLDAIFYISEPGGAGLRACSYTTDY